MFPEVEGRFSEEQLEDLGQSLEAAKKEFGKKTRAKAASSSFARVLLRSIIWIPLFSIKMYSDIFGFHLRVR